MTLLERLRRWKFLPHRVEGNPALGLAYGGDVGYSLEIGPPVWWLPRLIRERDAEFDRLCLGWLVVGLYRVRSRQ